MHQGALAEAVIDWLHECTENANIFEMIIISGTELRGVRALLRQQREGEFLAG